MKLEYDPGEGANFWKSIEKLPGYPSGEVMPIAKMIFESNAIYKLPALLLEMNINPSDPLLVVMDKTPMKRKGQDLKKLVMQILSDAGWRVHPFELEPDLTGQVHTDMPHIEEVKTAIQSRTVLIALGSGTVCDITKHAAFLYEKATGHRPVFVVFQTANSVSAYTSNMAPTFVEGVKRTLHSRYPDVLVCDLETLADAPYDMTVAGVGDLLAAFVSIPDWYLANRLGMDPTYTDFARLLMGPMDEIFMDCADKIHDKTAEGMEKLAKLIALGGLAMSLSHATTPMSGYEHVMSHILDMMAEVTHQPLAQHGSQVSLATLLAAGAYQHFLQEFIPQEVNLASCYPTSDQMHNTLTKIFLQVDPSGKVGEECWAHYRSKLDKWYTQRSTFEAFLKDWPEISKTLVAWSRKPERLLEILRAIEAPLTFAQLTPPASEEQAHFAFMSAPLMRERFTLGDMLIFLNWDRENLWKEIWKMMK